MSRTSRIARWGALSLFALTATAGAISHDPKRITTARTANMQDIALVDEMVMVAMRDGVRLATDVYLPKEGEGPFPVIYWRTP